MINENLGFGNGSSKDRLVQKVPSFKERFLLFLELCSLDMKQKTAGTALGYVWLYLNPLISISVIWFVFHFGLKASVGANSTYSLLIGLVCWQFILDAILSGMGAVTEKPYLVKKIKFPLEFLPLIKVTNCFRIHLPFIFLSILMSLSAGEFSWIRFILFVAFLPVIFVFLSSTVLLLSTAIVFYRDLQSIVTISMQLVFWLTPIIWFVPENPKLIAIFEQFNPINFVVSFYRYCFLGGDFKLMGTTIIFIIIVAILTFAALRIFNKLKEQFADVL